MGAQSVEGAVIFLLSDARNLCQPPSHRVRRPPEWQGFSEGAQCCRFTQPALEPLLAEAGRVGVGTQ